MIRTSDVEIERNILKCILQNKDYSRAVFTHNMVIIDHFTDLFHRDVFNTMVESFRKYGIVPESATKMKANILPFITYDKKFKTKESQRDIWLKSVERLYVKITPELLNTKESDYDLLESMRKARLLQAFVINAQDKLTEGNTDEVITGMGEVLNKSRQIDTVMTEGNIVEDKEEHKRIMKQYAEGLIKPVKTGIIGIDDPLFGEPKKIFFDDCLDGGLFPGEVTLVVGGNNTGKSFTLMEIIFNATKVEKQNGILFTIEMNKIKQQNRIYSRLTNIPYNKFKKGELTKQEMDLWERKLDWWQRNCGILHVTAFDKGATVEDIRNKARDAENKYGVEFSLFAIDYLNDMQPTGKYKSSKDWDAQGDISFGLTQLSKSWNNHRGIAVATASQMKATTKAQDKEIGKDGDASGNKPLKIDWQDAAFSPLPSQHATVGIGLSETKIDKHFKRIYWTVFKARDGEKGKSFYTYTDFAVSKIWSEKRQTQAIEDALDSMSPTEDSEGK